jgi:hypothetical protein
MRLVSRILVLLLGLSTAAVAQPLEWAVDAGGNGHWYLFVETDEPLNWSAANLLAVAIEFQGVPGHLATIANQEEDQWVLGHINSSRPWWIGGIQEPGADEPDGGWGWVTGEPWTYESWCPLEPSNTGGNEDRIGYADWTTCGVAWNDASQFNTCTGYIVEWEAAPIPSACELWGGLKARYR